MRHVYSFFFQSSETKIVENDEQTKIQWCAEPWSLPLLDLFVNENLVRFAASKR